MSHLPMDPDAEVSQAERRAPAPLHPRPGLVAWVALGGVVGTAARIGVGRATGRPDGLPLDTLAVNLVGAFVLGVVLEALARRGSDVGGRRLVRLGLGTGFCGSFTTYSSLAVDADLLAADGRVTSAVAYLAVSVVAGLLATALGIWAAAARHTSSAAGRNR